MTTLVYNLSSHGHCFQSCSVEFKHILFIRKALGVALNATLCSPSSVPFTWTICASCKLLIVVFCSITFSFRLWSPALDFRSGHLSCDLCTRAAPWSRRVLSCFLRCPPVNSGESTQAQAAQRYTHWEEEVRRRSRCWREGFSRCKYTDVTKWVYNPHIPIHGTQTPKEE